MTFLKENIVKISIGLILIILLILGISQGCKTTERFITSKEIKMDDFSKEERFFLACGQFYTSTNADQSAKSILCQGLIEDLIQSRRTTRITAIIEYCESRYRDSRDKSETCLSKLSPSK